ncbi:hypothetical protein [Lacticaseibacillus sp. GG6-2]
MMLGLILIVAVVVITIGLGYVNYALGKLGKSKQVGLVIPVAYCVVRLVMALVQKPNLGALLVALIPALIIAWVYYVLYRNGLRKAGNA